MLDLETKLALYPAAIARTEAALKLVPGVPEKKQLHWEYASLFYKAKEYPKAITAYSKWMERYGETPEAIMQVARCYDRQQDPKKAIFWYDKLLEKYPKHEKTSEIYWMRAWDLEAAGDYEEAIEFYYRQLADFSANKRGDWANFRVGLCQYKAGNAAASLQAFKAIREQVNSNAYPAGLFWESRALDSLRDSAGARASLIELARKYPFTFYGHLARQSLQRGESDLAIAGYDKLTAEEVVSKLSELSSPNMMNPNEEYVISFGGVKPGKYDFHCTPHLAMGMKGTITVQ